jgi:hypothetical protein
MPFQDLLLAAAALVIAIIGIQLPHPPQRVRMFLISLAGLVALITAVKAFSDHRDKEFLETALTSTLRPSNAEYGRIISYIDKQSQSESRQIRDCHYDDDGLTCFYKPDYGRQLVTLVMDRSEIAQLYAAGLGNRDTNTAVSKACHEEINPEDLSEDYKAKVSILGVLVYFDITRESAEFSYNDKTGVNISFETNGKKEHVRLTPDELKSFTRKDACHLFYDVEQSFRQKFAPFNLKLNDQ